MTSPAKKFNAGAMPRRERKALGHALLQEMLACWQNGATPERIDKCVEMVRSGASFSGRPGQQTALHMAAQLGFAPVARALIDSGADVNAREKSLGQTPLMQTRNPEIVSMLIGAGAKLNLRDKNGYTALAHMAHSLQPGLTQLLIDAGAKIDPMTNEGRMPTQLARLNGGFDLADSLIRALTDRHVQAGIDRAERQARRCENIDHIAHKGVDHSSETPVVPAIRKKPFLPGTAVP